MKEITEKDINATFHDIAYFIVVTELDDAQGFMQDGMRLLAIHTCEPKRKHPFSYCLGWPSSLGDVPSQISQYGY